MSDKTLLPSAIRHLADVLIIKTPHQNNNAASMRRYVSADGMPMGSVIYY